MAQVKVHFTLASVKLFSSLASFNCRHKKRGTEETPPPTYEEATGINLFFRQLSKRISGNNST